MRKPVNADDLVTTVVAADNGEAVFADAELLAEVIDELGVSLSFYRRRGHFNVQDIVPEANELISRGSGRNTQGKTDSTD